MEDTMPELRIIFKAKHRGVSHTAVEKAIQQGRIRTTESGLLDVAEADRDWERNTNSRNSLHLASGGGTGPSYAQSRAVREAYLARLAKLEFEQKSGQVVNVEEASRTIADMVMATRDGLLAIPSRVAAIIAAESDVRQVYQILDEEIRQTLTSLSQNLRVSRWRLRVYVQTAAAWTQQKWENCAVPLLHRTLFGAAGQIVRRAVPEIFICRIPAQPVSRAPKTDLIYLAPMAPWQWKANCFERVGGGRERKPSFCDGAWMPVGEQRDTAFYEWPTIPTQLIGLLLRTPVESNEGGRITPRRHEVE
jgi:hypothetical protein